jgi:hypothetical protein
MKREHMLKWVLIQLILIISRFEDLQHSKLWRWRVPQSHCTLYYLFIEISSKSLPRAVSNHALRLYDDGGTIYDDGVVVKCDDDHDCGMLSTFSKLISTQL